jgi:hypothetical protein
VFTIKKPAPEPTKLDKAIDDLLDEMTGYEGNTEEYSTMVSNLKVLHEAKALQPKPNVVSADTVATVAGSLAGILMILSFEKANIVTSKALGFVLRTKI